MMTLLSNKNCFLKLVLVISTVTVVLAEPMEIVSQTGQAQPFIFIERMKPATGGAPCNTNRTGLYVMWQKLLVRVSSQWQQSVLAKSFGVMKVPTGQELTPYSVEQAKLRNIAAEVEMEKRIINAVLTLMQILLALDIAILLGVLVMLLSCCCESKQPNNEAIAPTEVVKV
uniref:Uncharacterized protein n=1 Tax=Zeugodacus cucurbitae TaxID=28588 RepID=A0A0A1WU79_ZEUCU